MSIVIRIFSIFLYCDLVLLDEKYDQARKFKQAIQELLTVFP